ncbi:hypothetical protein TB1_007750 [Malus domestica]
MSFVILVTELSFSAMKQDDLQEVSFTAFASKALVLFLVHLLPSSMPLGALPCWSPASPASAQLSPSAFPAFVYSLTFCFPLWLDPLFIVFFQCH